MTTITHKPEYGHNLGPESHKKISVVDTAKKVVRVMQAEWITQIIPLPGDRDATLIYPRDLTGEDCRIILDAIQKLHPNEAP